MCKGPGSIEKINLDIGSSYSEKNYILFGFAALVLVIGISKSEFFGKYLIDLIMHPTSLATTVFVGSKTAKKVHTKWF